MPGVYKLLTHIQLYIWFSPLSPMFTFLLFYFTDGWMPWRKPQYYSINCSSVTVSRDFSKQRRRGKRMLNHNSLLPRRNICAFWFVLFFLPPQTYKWSGFCIRSLEIPRWKKRQCYLTRLCSLSRRRKKAKNAKCK